MQAETMLTKFVKRYSAEHGADKARDLERYRLKPFVEFTGGDFSPAMLDSYRVHLAESDYAPATRNWHLAGARLLLHYARRLKLLDLDREEVAELLPDFKVTQREPKTMSTGEIKTLLKQVAKEAETPNRAHWHAALGLLTGMRVRELFTLPREAVDLETQTIKVMGTKTERERTVPFDDSPVLGRLLAHLVGKAKPGDGLLVPDRKVYQGMINETWANLLIRAGLPAYPPKVTRATCAAFLGSSNKYSERQLRDRFGHSSKIAMKFYHSGKVARGETVEELLGNAPAFQTTSSVLIVRK